MILGVQIHAILLAGVAAWLVGAVWYGVLGRQWIAALGTTREALMGPSGRPSIGPFILSFVADCVLALTIALFMGVLTGGRADIRVGIAVALLLWIGCILTTTLVNNAFARRPLRLTLIDAGHWLFAMIAAGAVVGAFPVE